MSFLDNSGDIILDAVLTDTGRFRLAKGDGSFKIVKFALGDDEINYASYDKNNASGSAYYDLEILQTPVLEAFTNNTSTMKSKLISIPRTNLLYLPVIKLSGDTNAITSGSADGNFNGVFAVAVDENTVGGSTGVGLIKDEGTSTDNSATNGILNGYQPSEESHYVRADQGLDTTEIASTFAIDADLKETQYIIEIDNRLGSIVSTGDTSGLGLGGNFVAADVNFIDDDNIASYYLSTNDNDFVGDVGTVSQGIRGPRGTGLAFKIQASTNLITSTYLFEQLGQTGLTVKGANGTTDIDLRYIDSVVKVTGATTGYRIDIPVRFVKKV
tara:strand:+ start:22 stop:1005 length:984 start_codon:yes stop_codon:yes gene_type:complete